MTQAQEHEIGELGRQLQQLRLILDARNGTVARLGAELAATRADLDALQAQLEAELSRQREVAEKGADEP